MLFVPGKARSHIWHTRNFLDEVAEDVNDDLEFIQLRGYVYELDRRRTCPFHVLDRPDAPRDNLVYLGSIHDTVYVHNHLRTSRDAHVFDQGPTGSIDDALRISHLFRNPTAPNSIGNLLVRDDVEREFPRSAVRNAYLNGVIPAYPHISKVHPVKVSILDGLACRLEVFPTQESPILKNNIFLVHRGRGITSIDNIYVAFPGFSRPVAIGDRIQAVIYFLCVEVVIL